MHRSRLVARQLKCMDKSGEVFFAPTPPLEALRTVLSRTATRAAGEDPAYRDPTSECRAGGMIEPQGLCASRLRMPSAVPKAGWRKHQTPRETASRSSAGGGPSDHQLEFLPQTGLVKCYIFVVSLNL